jgi:hypothetical protein
MSPALLPTELLNHIIAEKGIMGFFWNRLTNWDAFWPISAGVVVMALILKFAPPDSLPTKKPLLPPGDFIHIILLAGNLFAKLLRKGIPLLVSLRQVERNPERILYRILDDKRTSQISASAETLLRRWEFVGIGFFIFFLALFLLLR